MPSIVDTAVPLEPAVRSVHGLPRLPIVRRQTEIAPSTGRFKVDPWPVEVVWSANAQVRRGSQHQRLLPDQTNRGEMNDADTSASL